MALQGAVAAAIRRDNPYGDLIAMGARFIADPGGFRTGGRPYYWLNGRAYRRFKDVPGAVVSRASEALGIDGFGNIRAFPAGEACELPYGGLQAYESRSNLVTASADVNGRQTGGVSFPAGPVSVMPARSSQLLGWPAGSYVTNGVPVSSFADNAPFAVYFVAKYVNHAWHRIVSFDKAGATATAWFNLQTRAVGTVQAGLTAGVVPLADDWGLYWVVRTNAGVGASTASTQFRPCDADNTAVYSGSAANQTALAHSQTEAGPIWSPPIVTSGAAATRAADNAQLAGLSSILTGPLTLMAWADLPAIDGVDRYLATVRNGASESASVRRNNGNLARLSVSGAGGGYGTSPVGSFAGATSLRVAGRVRAAELGVAANGSAVSTVASVAPTGLDSLYVGSAGGAGSPANGSVKLVAVLGDVDDTQLTRLSQWTF